ncbi:unnamed protein product [Ambrosiozyma monospora]|uniref:Unnamed protein product n=1 Tax=Ambrosiozyma monospora TaxID=43982 RepID=A0A9W7DCA6_AMBMO|nr:unnamed protein product [Ambrosiozyma monospora]
MEMSLQAVEEVRLIKGLNLRWLQQQEQEEGLEEPDGLNGVNSGVGRGSRAGSRAGSSRGFSRAGSAASDSSTSVGVNLDLNDGVGMIGGCDDADLSEQLQTKRIQSNLMQYYNHFNFRSHMCIVTELLSINLYQLIECSGFKGLDIPLLKDFSFQMLTGLKFIHDSGIIHCDLKPENLMLSLDHPAPGPAYSNATSTPSSHPHFPSQSQFQFQSRPHSTSITSTVSNSSTTSTSTTTTLSHYNLTTQPHFTLKIIDFGSSCPNTQLTYSYLQSRFYRAPEVCLGSRYDTKIDIWSLGTIVAELFTGVPLFQCKDEFELFNEFLAFCGVPSKRYILQLRMQLVDEGPICDLSGRHAGVNANAGAGGDGNGVGVGEGGMPLLGANAGGGWRDGFGAKNDSAFGVGLSAAGAAGAGVGGGGPGVKYSTISAKNQQQAQKLQQMSNSNLKMKKKRNYSKQINYSTLLWKAFNSDGGISMKYLVSNKPGLRFKPCSKNLKHYLMRYLNSHGVLPPSQTQTQSQFQQQQQQQQQQFQSPQQQVSGSGSGSGPQQLDQRLMFEFNQFVEFLNLCFVWNRDSRANCDDLLKSRFIAGTYGI